VLTGLAKDVEDWRKPINSFRAYFYREISQQVRLAGNGATGGVARGVYWAPYAPQYLRNDGTIVPAWGGVSKVRGKGTVKGRKRHDGSRVGPGDNVLDVRPSALLTMRHLTNTGMELTTRSEWATAQNAMRQYLFYQRPKDVQKFEELSQRWANARVRARQRSA
jgi:hypothetical protein